MPLPEPDVTVVVPVYNTMPYLVETLTSLLEQTLPHERFEVITVDDGSTDGSGEELDRWAAAHPHLFSVHHQANSGGPAGPCNVGLDLARGRFVYFLGADDHLGAEALERLVAAADRWNSDIVCGRMVGTNGRFVRQELYKEDLPAIEFPDRKLVHALSNTKLFRRSLLTEHGIRYSQDLRVGEDQPFTIEAMLRARVISVLASYTCYYAVRRENDGNLTYTTGWRDRFDSVVAVMDHVAGLLPVGGTRDDILVRHFGEEIAKILARDFAEADPAGQEAIVAAVRAVTARYLTPRIAEHLRVIDRIRFAHADAGRIDALRALVDEDYESAPVRLDGGAPELLYPRFPGAELPAETYRATVDRGRHMFARMQPATFGWDGDHLTLSTRTELVAPSGDFIRVAMTATEAEESRDVVRSGPRSKPALPFQKAHLASDGTLAWRGPVATRLKDAVEPRTWELRLQCESATATWAVPFHRGVDPGPRVLQHRGRSWEFRVLADPEDRVLLHAVPLT